MSARIQKLVMFTAYPSAGKTTLSKYLAETAGYERISLDDMLGDLDQDDVEIMLPTWVRNATHKNLLEGRNVVIDSTMPSSVSRQYYFDTQIPCEKYLIWLRTNPSKTYKRTSQRAWTQKSIEQWKVSERWEDPVSGDYTLFILTNNTPDDLETVKRTLLEKLSN